MKTTRPVNIAMTRDEYREACIGRMYDAFFTAFPKMDRWSAMTATFDALDDIAIVLDRRGVLDEQARHTLTNPPEKKP